VVCRRWAVLSCSIARLACAARCSAQGDCRDPPRRAKSQTQPISVVETAAVSGSAEKFMRISRFAHRTSRVNKWYRSFRIGRSSCHLIDCNALQNLTCLIWMCCQTPNIMRL
jgi:hypothetical protein